MNCEQAKQSCGQVQFLLVAYLDGEVTPSERALIQAHLPNCTVCQQELTLLSTARSQVRSMLQRRAVHAVPSREAWNRLEAKLPKVQVSFLPEAEQLSSKKEVWFSRKAPNGNRASNPHKKFGGVSMNKRSIFSVMAGVVVAILAVFVARNVTPASASAQQILERASEIQLQQSAAQGIQHIRNEIYSNLEANSDGGGMDTIVESYSDPANGNFRVVITDKETGTLLSVFAFDGSNAYNSEGSKSGQPGIESLMVYRSSQNRPSLLGTTFANRINGNAALDAEAKSMFDKMRQDPHVELLGQETLDNGHTVYVLRSQQEVKWLAENEITHPMGLVTLYFDVDTYQLVGNRVSMERNGKEVLISRQQILLDEVLPVGSTVAWDLSDLQGINIVEDPNGEHSVPETLAPNVIPAEALAAKTDSAYLLKKIPDGFSLEVSVLPKQPANELFFYEAGYTNQAGDYFIIRTFTDKPLEDTSWADETYTTASGLVLYFVNQPSIDAKFTGGLMQAPNGMTYAIDSTLPRDQIKALLEELVLVK